jgi:hypothetical protein
MGQNGPSHRALNLRRIRSESGGNRKRQVVSVHRKSLAFIGGDSAREAGLVLRCGCRATFDKRDLNEAAGAAAGYGAGMGDRRARDVVARVTVGARAATARIRQVVAYAPGARNRLGLPIDPHDSCHVGHHAGGHDDCGRSENKESEQQLKPVRRNAGIRGPSAFLTRGTVIQPQPSEPTAVIGGADATRRMPRLP